MKNLGRQIMCLEVTRLSLMWLALEMVPMYFEVPAFGRSWHLLCIVLFICF